MRSEALTPDDYFSTLPPDREASMQKLREILLANLPSELDEAMSYGMYGFDVPLSTYPPGYHVTPGQPLPFVGLASQKNHIALYHMGIYFFPEVHAWFLSEYSARTGLKPDMGKSCIRFRNPNKIPFDLIAELCGKITVDEFVSKYKESLNQLNH